MNVTIVHSEAAATELAADLIRESCWFAVEPLPFMRWAFQVKPEKAARLRYLANEADSHHEWCLEEDDDAIPITPGVHSPVGLAGS